MNYTSALCELSQVLSVESNVITALSPFDDDVGGSEREIILILIPLDFRNELTKKFNCWDEILLA